MALAETSDVAARLGRSLSDSEEETASFVVEVVSGLIAEIAGEDADWTPDPVPSELKLIVVEKAVAVLNNPEGYASLSEQLGAYQHSGTFPRSADVGVFLSADERRRVRKVLGEAFQAVTLASPYGGTVDDEWPELPLS